MKNLFIFLLLIFPISIWAQEKTIKIQLNPKVEFISSIDLSQNGIIILTGKQIFLTKNLEYTLRHYSSTLDLIWEKPIERSVYYQKFEDILISSNDGSFTYFLENTGKSKSKSERFRITQLDKEGNEKIKLIENVKNLWENVQSIFCDNDYLYILATINGNEKSNKSKNKEQLILKKISNKDFSINEIPLVLPTIENPKKSTFWYFLGNKNNQFYLVTQFYDDENKQGERVQFKILTLNSDGKILNTVVINDDLEGKHYRPSYNYKLLPNSYSNTFFDFDFGQKVECLPGAFGNITISDSSIYTSGIWGNKPFGFASSFEGYFVNKYNLLGLPIQKNRKVFPEELLNKAIFKIHAIPTQRMTALLLNDKSYTLHVLFNKKIFSFPYSRDDQPLQHYSNEFKEDVGLVHAKICFPPQEKRESVRHIENKTKKNQTFFQFFTSSKGDVILELLTNENKLNLLFFPFK